MWMVNTIGEMRELRLGLRAPAVLVPTLGALHDGHVQHIEQARDLGGDVVVSIFVNPTQFGQGEDFEQYPRPFDQDIEMCQLAGVTGVFCPKTSEVYPQRAMETHVIVPRLNTILEGAARPGHFAGVCRIMVKLLNVVQPDVVTFGCKDYQQMLVIKAMVADLNLPVRIEEIETVREQDGLACSSRNVYLSDEGRRRAVGLYKALLAAKKMIEQKSERDPQEVEAAMCKVLSDHHVQVDYAVVRDRETLSQLQRLDPEKTGGVAALIAGHVEDTHLIDNMLLGASRVRAGRC